MTRSKLLQAGVALLATLCGAACSEHGVAKPTPTGAGGSLGGAVGGAMDAAGATDVGGATNTGGPMDVGGAAGTDADCGESPEPNTWASWVMPNPVHSGLPNPASYAVSGNGNQVTDEVTGLIWQRHVDASAMTWDLAKQYCGCLRLDGESGWRLPSRIELASLVDWTSVSPSIDARAFPETTDENFWTASVVKTDPGLIYLVFFLNGHTTYAAFDYEYRARCVRSPAGVPGEHYTVANATVYDNWTKLTWQQVFPTPRYTWADAAAYCSDLMLDGGGWRVPSINELQTLVDDSINPSIDLTAFPSTPSEYFWSSSPVIDDPTRAWTGFFTNGSTYSFALTAPKNVRCVR